VEDFDRLTFLDPTKYGEKENILYASDSFIVTKVYCRARFLGSRAGLALQHSHWTANL
jgi:hypothetical protein